MPKVILPNGVDNKIIALPETVRTKIIDRLRIFEQENFLQNPDVKILRVGKGGKAYCLRADTYRIYFTYELDRNQEMVIAILDVEKARSERASGLGSSPNRLPVLDDLELPALDNQQGLAVAIVKERLQQSRISFNVYLVYVVVSIAATLLGCIMLFSGKSPEGVLATAMGLGLSTFSFREAKQSSKRLDELIDKLETERRDTETLGGDFKRRTR